MFSQEILYPLSPVQQEVMARINHYPYIMAGINHRPYIDVTRCAGS